MATIAEDSVSLRSVRSLCSDCMSTSSKKTADAKVEDTDNVKLKSESNVDGAKAARGSGKGSVSDISDTDSVPESWSDLFVTLDALFQEDNDEDEDREVNNSSDVESSSSNQANSTRADPDPDPDRLSEAEILTDFEQWNLINAGVLEEMEEDVVAAQIVPLYPMGKLEYSECAICCETVDLYQRACCACPVCDGCMLAYMTVQVEEARVKMGCPNAGCDQFVHRDEIIVRLSGAVKDKFFRFLVDANKEINVKTCPKCSTVTTLDKSLVKKPDKMGVRTECGECGLEWCFVCQAPFHTDMSCKGFRRGDKLLQKWAKENHFGQANAQKCPKCKAFISRTSGCDHMTCSQCRTEFCYRCGGRFISIRFLGDHYNRLSIFGCKYRLWPEKPSMRRFVRGSLFAAKLAVVPVVAGLALGACAVVAAAGVFVLPVVGSIKLHKWRKLKRAQKLECEARREWTLHWRARLEEVRQRGDPYLEHYRLMRLGGVDMSLRWYDQNAESVESIPETSVPKETEHVASVHKSGSASSSKEPSQAEPVSSEDSCSCEADDEDNDDDDDEVVECEGEEVENVSENVDDNGVVAESEPSLVVQKKVPEVQKVPLVEMEDLDISPSETDNEGVECSADAVDTNCVEISNLPESMDSSKLKLNAEDEVQSATKDDDTSKRIKDQTIPSVETPKEEIVLVQKSAKKPKEEEGCKVKSIVSQYSCLGGKSREEEEDEEEDSVVVVEERKGVGKLMIRSASYDVAIRDAETSVSVKQMVKRYSQGAS